MSSFTTIQSLQDSLQMAELFEELQKRGLLPGSEIENVQTEYPSTLSAHESLPTRHRIQYIQENRSKQLTVRGKHMEPVINKLMDALSAKVLSFHTPRNIFYNPGLQYALYIELEGKTLEETKRNAQFWNTYSETLGKCLAEIHSTRAPYIHKRTASNEKTFLDHLKKKLESRSTLDAVWHQLAMQLRKQARTVAKPEHAVLNHGHFEASNILFNSSTRTIGVIDFTEAERFHPALDVATFLMHTSVMLHPFFSKETIDKWLLSFLGGYHNNSSRKKQRLVQQDLHYFSQRTLLDIAGATVQRYPQPNKKRKQIFTILNDLLLQIR